ncbi:hypothetical protein F5Y08DRAFT_262192 [Xylaria arbuscula]|nr:hypothetical protein F5Y08DRAFT_262192 [Xylaria arbuscula]
MRQIKGPDYTPHFLSRNQTTDRENTPNFRAMKLDCGCLAYPAEQTVADGAKYLRRLPDEMICTNAPRTCGQISCSYNVAILWCNDDDEGVNRHRCNEFADYAQWIHDACAGAYTNCIGGNVYARLIDHDNKLELAVKKVQC